MAPLDRAAPTSYLVVFLAVSWAPEKPKAANNNGLLSHCYEVSPSYDQKCKEYKVFCVPSGPKHLNPWHRAMQNMDVNVCCTDRTCTKHFPKQLKRCVSVALTYLLQRAGNKMSIFLFDPTTRVNSPLAPADAHVSMSLALVA